MTDTVWVTTDRLTDTEVRVLRDTYRQMAADDDLPRPLRRWYALLADAMADVLSARVLEFAAVVADPAVPPSWEVAVAALRPEDEGA